MELAPLLEQRHLSIITRNADYELARVQDVIEHKVLVEGRWELEEVLGRLLELAARRALATGHSLLDGVQLLGGSRTLDLIGHSSPGTSQLVLGDFAIDASRPTVTAFFRELAEQEVLRRLGIQTVRLLGCETADTRQGRNTIRKLSDILGVEVYGTRSLIYAAHYDAGGLSDDAEHVLVAASDLRREPEDAAPRLVGERYDRVLDVDALPTHELRAHNAWPYRIADAASARALLRLIRRSEGLQMVGLLAAPSCEIALPSARPERYHLAQVLLDGEYLRVYPDGHGSPGVVYPVEDPHALRALVERLARPA